MQKTEGLIPVEGGRVWYEVVGDGNTIPLILVHGGPGYPHDYFEPLLDLASERPIIWYDQLGCGNSDKGEKSLWNIERYVRELQTIIDTLGLKKYHLLGQSWGAALATEFALSTPKGLASLILANPHISTPLWAKDAKRLIAQLPQDMQSALNKGDENSAQYKRGVDEYYKRFINRFDSYPEPLAKADKKLNLELYRYMWGPEEFSPQGTLVSYDPTPRLGTITVPTLLVTGRYDEATPEACEYFKSLFQRAELTIFEHSAHYPFFNERQAFNTTVNKFLQKQSQGT